MSAPASLITAVGKLPATQKNSQFQTLYESVSSDEGDAETLVLKQKSSDVFSRSGDHVDQTAGPDKHAKPGSNAALEAVLHQTFQQPVAVEASPNVVPVAAEPALLSVSNSNEAGAGATSSTTPPLTGEWPQSHINFATTTTDIQQSSEEDAARHSAPPSVSAANDVVTTAPPTRKVLGNMSAAPLKSGPEVNRVSSDRQMDSSAANFVPPVAGATQAQQPATVQEGSAVTGHSKLGVTADEGPHAKVLDKRTASVGVPSGADPVNISNAAPSIPTARSQEQAGADTVTQPFKPPASVAGVFSKDTQQTSPEQRSNTLPTRSAEPLPSALATAAVEASPAQARSDSAQPTTQAHAPENKRPQSREEANPTPIDIDFSVRSATANPQTATGGDQSQLEDSAAKPGRLVSDEVLTNALSSVPSAARADNLAFTLRLEDSSPAPARSAATPQPSTVSDQTKNTARNEPAASVPPPPAISTKDPTPAAQSDSAPKLFTDQMSAPSAVSQSAPPSDFRPQSAPAPASGDAARPNSVTMAHEALAPQADAPKTGAATEIQLRLTTDNRSSAALRVTERGGTVDVSVHASDSELRTTLRSNLSDLSGQLSSQGWRNEVVKTGVTVSRPQAEQDSGSGTKDSSQQQQQFADDQRQSQRDRKASTDDWQDALEEYASGNHAGRGGQQ